MSCGDGTWVGALGLKDTEGQLVEVMRTGTALYGRRAEDIDWVYLGVAPDKCPHGWALLYQDLRIYTLCPACGQAPDDE